MKERIKAVLDDVRLIEKRPKMFMTEVTYNNLSSFFTGYLFALEKHFDKPINFLFSEWVGKKGSPNSLFWTKNIFLLHGNENEEESINVLFDFINIFFNEMLEQELNSINVSRR